MSTTPTTSRARLPHDRVGILEDRIQLDPRGDTEAWLDLINEHRSRNRIENAREVYERFFKVFPTAVSGPYLYFTQRDNGLKHFTG
jgi:cleavage stimulation factor subunit 3